jgi:hypothetical protein
MAGGGRLPFWVWLIPLSTAIAAVVAWTAWCGTEDGTLIGGVLIAASGLLVFSLGLEALAHRDGLRDMLRRTGIAVALALGAAAVTFLAAGLGHELRCPILFD